MTGKIPGPFEIEYLTISDAYNNSFTLPKCTAIAMITSSLSMLKVCVDLNLLKIHVKDKTHANDSNKCKLLSVAFIYIPFFVATAMYRLYAISILMTYANYGAVFPVAFVIGMNVLYGKKK